MTTLQLSNPKAKNNILTGGKGSSLAKMIAAGLAVPDGFVVTTQAYTMFNDGHIYPTQ